MLIEQIEIHIQIFLDLIKGFISLISSFIYIHYTIYTINTWGLHF